MPDRFLLPLLSLIALAMIAVALVWPQGLGARSPAPFGHQPVQQSQAAVAARARAKQPPPELPMAPTLSSSTPPSASPPAP